MGRTVHNRRGAPTRHVQAGERKRRSPHQRLEHTTATSFLPLTFQAISILFVIAFSISQNNKEVCSACLFFGNPPDPRGLGRAQTLRYAWLYPWQSQASLGGYYGGTPERPQKLPTFFRPSRGTAYASGIRHPPHHPTPTLLMNANFLADVYLSRVRRTRK